MPNKRKVKFVKPIDNNGSPDVPLQFNVKKDVEDSKKIKPTDVFDGYTKKNDKRKKSSK
jgi:hypothetical protein